MYEEKKVIKNYNDSW